MSWVALYGGEDEPVLVKIVMGVVGCVVFFQDAESVLPDAFAQIGGNAAVMVVRFVTQVEFLGFELLAFGFGEVIVFHHLVEHGVASLEASFGMEAGIVVGGTFQHADKGCSLGEGEFRGGGGKVFLCRAFNAEGVFTEGDGVQVQCQYFIFCIGVFQTSGYEHFFEFDDRHESDLLFFSWIQVLCKLLADGAAASCTSFA